MAEHSGCKRTTRTYSPLIRLQFYNQLPPTSDSFLALQYELVAEQQECGGAESWGGEQPTLQGCAHACEGISTMFVYGTNEWVPDHLKEALRYCNAPGCRCFCEIVASPDGTCVHNHHFGYRLYRFTSKK